MSTRPVIFISAVSKELRSARDLVAKTLLVLGHEPKWQDIAATDAGDLRYVLRKWVDDSDAVLQLVGQCYGFGPIPPDPDFGECSYTQYEALYAKQQGKPVYYIFTDATHPTDGCGCEPKTLHDLQAQYRKKVKGYGDLYHRSDSLDKTELIVRRLKDDLAEMRKEAKASQDLLLRKAEESIEVQRMQLAAINDLRWHFNEVVQGGSLARLQQDYDTLLHLVSGWYEQDPECLATEMRKRAYAIVADPNADLRAKVSALREAGDFIKARDFAIEAAQRLAAIRQKVQRDEVQMWIEAAVTEISLGHFDKALEYATKAVNQADGQADFPTWSAARYQQGRALRWLKKDKEARAIYEALIPQLQAAFGKGNLAVLQCRRSLAISLYNEGAVALAEQQFRDLVAECEIELGAENPNAVASRIWLANTLASQAKHKEAKRQHQLVLNAVKGMRNRREHYSLSFGMVLFNRLVSNLERMNSASSETSGDSFSEELPHILLCQQNLIPPPVKDDEDDEVDQSSETEIEVPSRVQDQNEIAKQTDTASSLLNKANGLRSQKRYAEAEQAYREILTLSECEPTTESSNLAWPCYFLALCLEDQQKLTEAQAFMQQAEQVWTHALGPDCPNTRRAKRNSERLEARVKAGK